MESRTAVLAFLIGAAVATCASCAAPRVLAPAATRTPGEQARAAVLIHTTCLGESKHGTGTIVSDEQILTAAHVVTCPLGVVPVVQVDPGDGWHAATTELILPSDDIARVRAPGARLSRWWSPIRVAEMPGVGERVCWVASAPRPTYRCGTSQGARVDADGHVAIDGFVEHGNSGSPLYDEDGALVGIVIANIVCQTGVYCVGFAVPVGRYPWLIP